MANWLISMHAALIICFNGKALINREHFTFLFKDYLTFMKIRHFIVLAVVFHRTIIERLLCATKMNSLFN